MQRECKRFSEGLGSSSRGRIDKANYKIRRGIMPSKYIRIVGNTFNDVIVVNVYI
jgi:hypothetical protein